MTPTILALAGLALTIGGILIGLGKVLQKIDLLTESVKDLKVDVKFMHDKMFSSQERISIVESKIKNKRTGT